VTGGDQLDPAQVAWLDADVSRWARTSRITRADTGDDHITIDHTAAGRWPTVLLGDDGAVEGNPWILVQRDGRWYGHTYEWLAPGQSRKAVTGEDLAAITSSQAPGVSFRPRPGELVGLMVSAPARSGDRTVEERSNIVLVRWGSGTGPARWPGSAAPASLDPAGRSRPVTGAALRIPGTPDPLRHRTDFLTMTGPDGTPLFTHEYAGLDPAGRAAIRQALRARGYTHAYVYAANEGDYGGHVRFDGYDDPSTLRARLQELVDDGLAPVVWLAPDDADAFHAANPPERLRERWAALVPAIDDLVSSYVLGLEGDEYWTDPEQDALGQGLRALTARPIFVHGTPGRWELGARPWASGVVYQYGFGRSEAEIAARTRELVARLAPLGKTLIAGEYAYGVAEAQARQLGSAALRAGASGVGNGAAPA
jgi:hypothetical protein